MQNSINSSVQFPWSEIKLKGSHKYHLTKLVLIHIPPAIHRKVLPHVKLVPNVGVSCGYTNHHQGRGHP